MERHVGRHNNRENLVSIQLIDPHVVRGFLTRNSASLQQGHRNHRHLVSVTSKLLVRDDSKAEAQQTRPHSSKTKKVDKREQQQQPDRVLGLCTCDLYSIEPATCITDDMVLELRTEYGLKISVLSSSEASSLVLPYGIVEAKNAQLTGWPEVESQAKGPISKFLKLQIDLQLKAQRREECCGGIVWFFAYIGPYWKLYFCYADWIESRKDWEYVSERVVLV
jgi:hypothetical protein